MSKLDIMSYDYLSVKLKKDKAIEIIEYYQKFQWAVIEKYNDKRYDNIIHASFKRDHYISNKDELQLLQVYLENEINKIGRIERNKYSKTIALGIITGVFGVLLITIGALLGLIFQPLFIILGIIGINFLIYFSFKLRNLYYNEKIKYSQNINFYTENIKKILKDLEELIK